ncbi:MAG: mycofactocin-coupled SDR family oxidoreductase [Microthrixaceae bacterium]
MNDRSAANNRSESNNRARFDHKVVFITGVARGQGREHALRFAAEGARIIGVDLCEDLPETLYPMATPDDLAETVRQVESSGGEMVARTADVRDLPSLREAFVEGFDRFGRIDIVVANAGIYTPTPVQFATSEQWSETIDINLTGVFNSVKVAVRRMIEQREGGAIAITSSIAGLKGMYGTAAYNASKHGVVGFMRSIALELAPHRIRVNTVHPTSVDTPMINNDVFPSLVRSDLESPNMEDVADFLRPQQPLNIPWVEASDISDAVLWLCSDEARYVTGVTLPIDGGALLR